MSAQDALRKAAGEIGYYAPSDPAPGSKYGRWEAGVLNLPWLAGPSVTIWWCAIFVSWVLDGIAILPGLPGFNTDRLRALNRAATLPNMRDAQPGDLVIFDWDKTTAATNHIGIVEINAGDYLQTIEGNTSGSDGARQSNGNGVWRRTRSWDAVVAVIRPTWLTNTTPPVIPVSRPIPAPAPIHPPFPGYIRRGSISGVVRMWQARLNLHGHNLVVDGIDGQLTTAAVKAEQIRAHIAVDGIGGPITWGVI